MRSQGGPWERGIKIPDEENKVIYQILFNNIINTCFIFKFL